jgi:excisionase family DNA binding protein
MGFLSQIAPDDPSRHQEMESAASRTFLGFEPYVTPEEAADFLKVTPRRVKDMARAGAIPAHPVDPKAERKEWRFLLSELSAWMRNNSGKKRKF